MTHSKSSQLASSSADRPPYKLGVALSGGGARGFAHVGALLALEEAGLKPDVIAGVSAGSVVAVLYASGIRPLKIVDIFARTGFSDFATLSLGSGGIFSIANFQNYIMRCLGDKKNIEDLDIPTFIGATDLDNAMPHVFSSGAIGPRMLASCSIPIVFAPVVIDGVHYVDGGVLRNLPAWILRDKCEKLIGINVSPLSTRNEFKTIMSVAMRTYNLMTKANQSDDMAICDVSVMTPEIASHAPFSLKNIKEIVLSGYYHTRKALQDAGMWKTADKEQKS